MESTLFDQSSTPLAGKGDAKIRPLNYTRSLDSSHPPVRRNAPNGTSEAVSQTIAAIMPNQRARSYQAILASRSHELSDDESTIRHDMFAASNSIWRSIPMKMSLIRDTTNPRMPQTVMSDAGGCSDE